MQKFAYLLLLALLPWISAKAQVTTEPDPLQEDATDVVIYFHADEGNQGLINTPQTTPLYAHTGVDVTSADGTVTSWKYAPKWEVNDDKYKLEYVSPNLWKLYIGNIRDFYGVADDETISRLCFVFRNATGSKEGKAEGNKDIFVDVVDSGFQLAFRSSVAANVLISEKKVNFTATTTQEADIKMYVNDKLIGEASNVKTLRSPFNFNTPGEYTIRCEARNGNLLRKAEEYILYTAGSQPNPDNTIPPLGVTKNADGSLTFCFAAPGKNTVALFGSWNDFKASPEQICKYVDRMIDGNPYRYFMTTLPKSTFNGPFTYYFSADKTSTYALNANVADPYSRLILDPSNDRYITDEVYPDMPKYPEEKVPSGTYLSYYSDNLLDYDWQCTDFKAPSKENLVIYEMLFRDFTGTEGKALGNGTVKKAIDKLYYLKNLGINAVELLPINEFNGNISWGYNPNFYFAPDKAYGTPQDYKEFIDLCHQNGIAVIIDVVFNQTDGGHPWYQLYNIADNPFYNKNAPHAYSVLNDWNQGHPLVEEQWCDMLKFWLKEYKVDGFRFDLVKGLGDNDSYKNSSGDATNAYNASRVARMKRLHDAMREVNPDAYFINENLAGQKEENEMAADGELNWANLNNNGCQFAMGYSSGASLNGMDAKKYGRTPGSTVAYLESHDEERLAYKQETWGVAGVKDDHKAAMQRCGSAAAQMILVPGSHMIWMFSEMGNAQTTKNSSGNNTGPKIVNWNLLNDPDNAGLAECYRQLISIRLQHPELFPVGDNFANSCSMWSKRTITSSTADKELFCVINPAITGEATIEANFRSDSNDTYWISSKSYDSNPSFDAAKKTITVPAGCYAVVTTKNISGVKGIATDNTLFNVSATQGELTVTGAQGRTEIWNLSGTRAAVLDGDGSVNVPAGIYAVRNGNKCVKVIVR